MIEHEDGAEVRLTFADAVQSLPLDFVFVHQSHRLVVLYKDQLQPQQEGKRKKIAELSPGPSTAGEKTLQNILPTCKHIREETSMKQRVMTNTPDEILALRRFPFLIRLTS